MKNYLKLYTKTAFLLLILLLSASIILATFITFIPISNSLYHILLYVISYAIIMVSAIYFYRIIPRQLLLHSCIFALCYLLLSLSIHIGAINWITLLTRPLVFIVTNILLSYFTH